MEKNEPPLESRNPNSPESKAEGSIHTNLDDHIREATLWDQAGQPLAKGEVFSPQGLKQPSLEGRFEPTEKQHLETLKASAKFVSWSYPTLWPIEVFEMHDGCSEHVHFLFGVESVKHPFRAV